MDDDSKKMLAKVDEMVKSDRRCLPLSLIEYDDEECIKKNMKMEVATHQHIQPLEEHAHSCLEKMPDEVLGYDFSHTPLSDYDDTLDGTIDLEDLESPKYTCHHDFVEISMKPVLKEPCLEVDKGSKEYLEDERLKIIIGNLEESALIKLNASIEDPFLPILPQDKFKSFEPYISRPLGINFHNPLIFKRIVCKKGLSSQRKFNHKFRGRGFKWDLKVD